MGADEKHAATCHGGEYTPPVRDLRMSYVALRDKDTTSLEEVREEFQRGIDRIRAEAKAEALNEVADEWERLIKIGKQMFAETTREDNAAFDDWASQDKPVWLRARANQYKETQ